MESCKLLSPEKTMVSLLPNLVQNKCLLFEMTQHLYVQKLRCIFNSPNLRQIMRNTLFPFFSLCVSLLCLVPGYVLGLVAQRIKNLPALWET